jgi:hypothetical protein
MNGPWRQLGEDHSKGKNQYVTAQPSQELHGSSLILLSLGVLVDGG